MSLECNVYLKQDLPDRAAFESYAKGLGFQITVHPEADFMNHTGFCPIRLTDTRLADNDGTDTFVSGFEIYHDDFHQPTAPASVSKGFLGLFRKKTQPKETPFDMAVKGSSVVICLRFGAADSLEILMAYLFGAYCVRNCNAVFDDPQYGCYYDDPTVIENEISNIVDELCEEKEAGTLCTHRFEGWN